MDPLHETVTWEPKTGVTKTRGGGVGAGAGAGVGVYLSLILFVSFCFFFCFLKNAVLGLRLGLVSTLTLNLKQHCLIKR